MTIKIELEFVPVSERLPEESGDYLIAYGPTDFDVCRFDESTKKIFCTLFPELTITHWAKLPDLSKAKEERSEIERLEMALREEQTKAFARQIASPNDSNKAMEEQRRRDMFEKVVMMIASNSYCGMTSHGELFEVASKLATDILKESDKFAREE